MGIIREDCRVPDEPEAELTWTGVILFFPVMGLILYFMGQFREHPLLGLGGIIGCFLFVIVSVKVERAIADRFGKQ